MFLTRYDEICPLCKGDRRWPIPSRVMEEHFFVSDPDLLFFPCYLCNRSGRVDSQVAKEYIQRQERKDSWAWTMVAVIVVTILSIALIKVIIVLVSTLGGR